MANLKVKGLNKRIYVWNLTGNIPTGEIRPRSKYHLQARSLLKALFKCENILEEITLPGCSTTLYLDFYLPARKLAVEVQGEQHYEYNEFMHGSEDGFQNSLKRDKEKVLWCELNGINFVELPFSESLSEWQTRIIRALTGPG